MCGIAGILRIHDPKDGDPPPHVQSIPEQWLDTLDESIKHRGPDGAGRFRDRSTRDDGFVVDVALVHRRLSIIDHAGGRQPMVHDGDRLRPDLTYGPGETPRLAHELEPDRPLVSVVFNGCIYNHRELRAELESLGHSFETDHSDTEVLAHGWRAWREYARHHWDAMLAVGVWDRSSARLASTSDDRKEKPLFATFGGSPDYIAAFASTTVGLRHLNDLQDFRSETNLHPAEFFWPIGITWVDDLVACRSGDWRSPLAPSVQPMAWRLRQRDACRNLVSVPPTMRDRSSTDHSIATLLSDAVSSRLTADVPLGVFLSGGIDSALIAAITKQHRPDIKTFTVRMPEAAYDESEDAAETAAHIGTDHHTLDCDPNPAEDLVHLIQQLGLPFGDSSLLPTYWVSKAAREHVKVALSGDGGDELFGGYRRHTINPMLNSYRRLLRLIPTRLLDRRTPGTRSEYLARLVTAARFGGYTELLAIFQTPDLRRLIPSIDGEPVGDDDFHTIDDPLRYDFEHYLPDDLLRKTDTASMAVGLEVRAPFLARELVEAALRTSLKTLMPNGERKGLLKQFARKYLPDHIVDRPKRGFAIPIGDLFRGDYGGMRSLLYDHLESAEPFPGLAEAGVELNMAFVKQMLREHDAAGEKSINPWRGRDHSQRLYMLLVLSIWCRWLARIQKDTRPA
ncbi:MAG: asparagine synthase (glutamine-hydrolyzing) [Planctomycetota bacterium]